MTRRNDAVGRDRSAERDSPSSMTTPEEGAAPGHRAQRDPSAVMTDEDRLSDSGHRAQRDPSSRATIGEDGADERGTREPLAASGAEPKGPVGTRREVGDSRSSREHPPHVTENDEGAPVQEHLESPEDVPTLPANAQGSDTQPTDGGAIDEESMYDRRPSEDKDRPPSSRDVP